MPIKHCQQCSQVFLALKDWPAIVDKFRKMHNTSQRQGAAQTTTLSDIALSDTKDRRQLAVGLQSLHRAQGYFQTNKFNKVMYNVEVLVFSIWWFSSVCGIANNILSFH
jgi:hypothetical protein